MAIDNNGGDKLSLSHALFTRDAIDMPLLSDYIPDKWALGL